MMMSSTLEMPLTPTAPVAVEWGALDRTTEASGTSSPSRRCGRCNTRAVAALNHGAPRCLACGAEADSRRRGAGMVKTPDLKKSPTSLPALRVRHG